MQTQSELERALMLWILLFGALVLWSIHVVTSQERLVSIASQRSFFEGSGLSSARQQFDTTNCTSGHLRARPTDGIADTSLR
jgi:hypothetical protein